MKTYWASDGKLFLRLQAAKEGGYTVTSPLDPALVTQSADLVDAFVNAHDAAKTLAASRAKRFREFAAATRRKRRR